VAVPIVAAYTKESYAALGRCAPLAFPAAERIRSGQPRVVYVESADPDGESGMDHEGNRNRASCCSCAFCANLASSGSGTGWF